MTTTTLTELYPILGDLMEYPTGDFKSRIDLCREKLAGPCPEAAASLAQFAKALDPFGTRAEEAYLRAFDIAALCVPYVSVILFGEENFRRGEFMARLREAYEKEGFDCGGELPDHLSILLKYAPRLSSEERRDLLECCLREPLKKMKTSLRKADHPYQHLLQALVDLVETDLTQEVCHA